MTDAMSPTPSAATRTLSAMFDTREDAERAVQTLIDEGIPQERVRLTPGAERDSTGSPGTASRDRDEGGFWQSLEEFFFPDEDRAEYAEGLRRGGYLVTVQATQAEHDLALDILDDEGTIDIDDRADSWRREGWSGTGALSGTSGAAASGTSQGRGTDAVIPVAEEELQVGKREVEGGRVRVRSYVVETPVQEQVMLRREHVDVERRQVDRPLGSAEDAFRERTVELDERSEQPVVNKQARIREEVVLRKDVEERPQTVSDTVRRTEVEVDRDPERDQEKPRRA
jgi:uncharacterized protein (TIGR02271 family)